MWFLLLLLPILVAAIVAIDPSMFFTGTKPRPKLEIIHPENGQVLTSSDLDIQIAITGWDHPSSLFGSSICVGLSCSSYTNEKCFEQTPELVFHVGGLLADTTYSLRIVLFERDKAIAVSIRSFHVAGIRIIANNQEDQVLTIQTAVQVALSYQTAGDTQVAQTIYQQVLSVVPLYPDALHLLGLAFHQQGATSTAISYIERALQGTKAFEGYHNSLGECYRVLGRISDAEIQFEKAIALNPHYVSSLFNLGLLYQQSGQLERAIVQFQKVDMMETVPEESRELMAKSKIHECDLLALSGRHPEAIACWKEGISKYPHNNLFYNELGSSLLTTAKMAGYEDALLYYGMAASMGNMLSGMNQAHLYESLGEYEQSIRTYETIMLYSEAQKLPNFHMKIKMATLLPRVIWSKEQLVQVRQTVESNFVALLAEKQIVPDNAPPTEYGFSTGFFLETHGENNLKLKLMLARTYVKFCPALLTGRFVVKPKGEDHWSHSQQSSAIIRKDRSSASTGVATPDVITSVNSNDIGEQQVNAVGDTSTPVTGDSTGSPAVSGVPTSVAPPLLKIGFVSRFFQQHSVGVLSQGLVSLLARSGCCEVAVFLIDGLRLDRDHVTDRVIDSAHTVYILNADLAVASKLIREASLDMLIYSEVGIDPVSYFLAFSRLAKVQVALAGHPDTSGVPNLDYFITSHVDTSETKYYSEKVYRMKGLGVPFVDYYGDLSHKLTYTNEMAAAKKQWHRQLALPKNCHIYGISETLHHLHPHFDDIMLKILTQDKLGYIVFLDHFNSTSIRNIYLKRLELNWNASYIDHYQRVRFFVPEEIEEMQTALSCIQVILDPFPVNTFQRTLEALSLGVPVVTYPSDKLSGRHALALYALLEYQSPDLIVSSESDYIKAALALAHSKKLRKEHKEALLARRHVLYDERWAADEWRTFIESPEIKGMMQAMS